MGHQTLRWFDASDSNAQVVLVKPLLPVISKDAMANDPHKTGILAYDTNRHFNLLPKLLKINKKIGGGENRTAGQWQAKCLGRGSVLKHCWFSNAKVQREGQ